MSRLPKDILPRLLAFSTSDHDKQVHGLGYGRENFERDETFFKAVLLEVFSYRFTITQIKQLLVALGQGPADNTSKQKQLNALVPTSRFFRLIRSMGLQDKPPQDIINTLIRLPDLPRIMEDIDDILQGRTALYSIVGPIDAPIYDVRDMLADNDHIYAAETFRDRITVMTKFGGLEHRFGGRGEGNGQFRHPSAICADNDHIFVCEQHNQRIQVFTKLRWPEVPAPDDDAATEVTGGAFVRTIGAAGGGGPTAAGSGNYQLRFPQDLCIDDQHIYVADDSNSRIQVYTKNGVFVRTIGETGIIGNDNTHFNGCVSVDVDDNNLYVVDQWNYRVQVLSKEGEYVRTIPFPARPILGRLCVDGDHLYVTVSDVRDGNDAVYVYTKNGVFVRNFGNVRGRGNAEFNMPMGLFVDPSGLLFVCDTLNNRIQVFLRPLDELRSHENEQIARRRRRAGIHGGEPRRKRLRRERLRVNRSVLTMRQ